MIPSPLKDAACLFLAEEDHAKTGSDCLAVIEAAALVKLAENFLAEGFHLEDISGLMVGEGAVSVYHFNHFDNPCRCTVLVIAPPNAAKFPSIAAVYQGAEWHERETRDFYGFTYEGNPNFIPLLLAEGMVDVHPLKKDASALAPLLAIFGAPERNRKVVGKAESFTLLDLPEPELKEEKAGEASREAAGEGGSDA